MDNPTIQIDLAQILNKLDGKLDKLDKKFDEKFDKLDKKFDGKFDKLDKKFDEKFDKLDKKFDGKFDKLEEKIENLTIGQTEIRGEVKALDAKTEQLNTRLGNVEFAIRGILIGLAVVVFGGFAMLFWMSSKL